MDKCTVSIFQDHRGLQLQGCFIYSYLRFNSTLNIYLNRFKQSINFENFYVLQSVGKIIYITIVSSNQNDKSDENNFLLIKNRTPEKLLNFQEKHTKLKKSEEVKLHCKHSWFSAFDFICSSKSADGLF